MSSIKELDEHVQYLIFAGAINTEIFNGKPAKLKQFPYQAVLNIHHGDGTGNECGGALLEGGYILTAAHCFINAVSVDVYLGIVNTKDKKQRDRGYSDYLPISRVTVHEDYDHETRYNDIALVRLSDKLKDGDNEFIATMPLPDPSWAPASTFDNYNVTLAGFGKTHQSQRGFNLEMLFATLHKYVQKECIEYHQTYHNYTITEQQICTDKKVINTGACQGDSGGPLTVTVDGKERVIGVVSFQYNICEEEEPNVYVNVAHYLDWIHKHTSS